jgi:hypothetical protein
VSAKDIEGAFSVTMLKFDLLAKFKTAVIVTLFAVSPGDYQVTLVHPSLASTHEFTGGRRSSTATISADTTPSARVTGEVRIPAEGETDLELEGRKVHGKVVFNAQVAREIE